MNKNIKDYLHLYFKCWGLVSNSKSDEYEDGKWVLSCGVHEAAMLGLLVFKPILRPLSDILSIPLEQKRQLLEAGLMYSHAGDRYTIWSPEAVRLACSFGIDIFGLIEAGLAIDEMNEKREEPAKEL
jgi:hypothetical protein